ncbi:MAG: hypothetical protein ACXVB9_08185 [Bdellovibrionota bacterium]
MNQIFCSAALIVLGAFLYQQPARADGVPGAGKEIASCAVSDPADPDFGSRLEIFQHTAGDSSVVVVFGKEGEKSLFPADSHRFSADKSSLEVQFAKFIFAEIPRGSNVRGVLRVKLGGQPSSLTCDSSW